MAHKITSVEGFPGTVDHYDENGKCVGHSVSPDEGMFIHYDEHWRKIGSSQGFFGAYENYDEHYNKIGTSIDNGFGAIDHYDEHWNKTGSTFDALFAKETYLDESPEEYFGMEDSSDF